MLKLNELVKLTKKRKRVGRGGSRGGTSGKGHKGQKARSGKKVSARFEGGQMPVSRRLPKRGFNNSRFTKDYSIVTLAQLEKWFEANTQVTKDALYVLGIDSSLPIKLLANGELTKKLTIEIDACSMSAKKLVEKVGGEVTLV